MDRKLHNRKSIRLQGYDYTQAGLYFVTICTQNREHLFGKIYDGQLILNEPGKMIEIEWSKLTDRFKNIRLHEYMVMPNHFHAILEIVGATLVVDPDDKIAPSTQNGKTLGEMVGSFKSITTVAYIHGVKTNNWKCFDGKLWQRNYWEHIIRNKMAHQRIAQYIIDNPIKWEKDKLNNRDGNMVMEPSADYGNENWNNIL